MSPGHIEGALIFLSYGSYATENVIDLEACEADPDHDSFDTKLVMSCFLVVVFIHFVALLSHVTFIDLPPA